MKRHLLLALGAVFLAACGAGGEAAAPAGFPPEIQARIEAERQECAAVQMGALEEVPLDALRTGDFNADGAPDYVLSHEAFRCAESGSMYCGSAGCSFTVFVSTPGGGLDAINQGNAQDVVITRDGDRDVLDLALHGSVVGAETEYARLRWDGDSFEPQ
ncbi:MAG TPA: hypothetical protein PLS69_01110 [Terricaulis sp.]|nr:hypothetical protein [Terricaulis sp.]